MTTLFSTHSTCHSEDILVQQITHAKITLYWEMQVNAEWQSWTRDFGRWSVIVGVRTTLVVTLGLDHAEDEGGFAAIHKRTRKLR